jgi:membrane-associated phospholipid phosphatase
MKKLMVLVALGFATWCGVDAKVTLDAELKAALPNGEFFLPAPPEVGSLIWKDDSTKYFQYKEAARKWDDEKQDRWDSAWAIMNEPYYFALYRVSADSVMNAPFVTDVTWTRNAKGVYTVSKTLNTTDFPEMNNLQALCEQMKEDNTSGLWRTRPRPYKYFGTWYKGKQYKIDLTDKTSYPSGHGYFAGLFGMCLLYIDPANALAIKNMLDEWLNCRLLLGAHWNTDLSAGWQLGAIAFSIAMNYDQFRNQVLAAKAELEAYRAAHSVPTDAPSVQTPAKNDGKTMVNGQLLIEHNGVLYDAQGAVVR